MSHMFAGKTFFSQTFAALPGKSSDFIRTYKESFAPMLERRGLRKVAFWQTSMIEGPSNEFLALWEFDSAAEAISLTRALDSVDDGDPTLQAARDELSTLVSCQEGWTYLGSAQSMSLTEI